jgi:hypothetical protein
MNSDTEKFRSTQEQGTRNSTGSVDTSDSKGNSLPTKESQNNPPHDISKKNPTAGHRLSAPRSAESRRGEAAYFLSNSFGNKHREEEAPRLERRGILAVCIPLAVPKGRYFCRYRMQPHDDTIHSRYPSSAPIQT